MDIDFWLSIFAACASIAGPLALYLGRNWLTAWFSKGLQHRFDIKIEELRAELRKNEERVKSELRIKETEISTLRENVLSGSAGRQTLLDKRRFMAVERVWTAVNDMAQYKLLANMMASVNFQALAAKANDSGVRQFLETLEKVAPDVKQLKNVARDERPFLPELAWALFSAYSVTVLSSFIHLQILKGGFSKPDKLMKNESLRNILKAALPHQSTFIDENEPELYFYLLDELESSLLVELRKILEGKESDQAATIRAKEIIDAVRRLEAERAQQSTPVAQTGLSN